MPQVQSTKRDERKGGQKHQTIYTEPILKDTVCPKNNANQNSKNNLSYFCPPRLFSNLNHLQKELKRRLVS